MQTPEQAAFDSADHHEFLWRDGTFVPWDDASIHVSAVGHRSVAAIFEGVRVYRAAEGDALHAFRLRDHLARFVRSLKLVRLAHPYSLDELVEACLSLLQRNEVRGDCYLRPWAFSKANFKRIMPPPDAPAEIVIASWNFPTRLLAKETCRACVSSWRRTSDQVGPPRIKAFANYYNGRLAQMEAMQNGFDWAILLNEQGKVSEGSSCCVGMVRDGAFITPDLSSGVLESITRDTFLALAPTVGLRAIERPVDRSELYVADELFFMGTGRELLPVVDLDHHQIADGSPGPFSGEMEKAYHDIVRAVAPDPAEWRTRV